MFLQERSELKKRNIYILEKKPLPVVLNELKLMNADQKRKKKIKKLKKIQTDRRKEWMRERVECGTHTNWESETEASFRLISGEFIKVT